MKKLSLFLLSLYYCISFAQAPGGFQGERPAIGKLFGTVLDGTTGKPLEYSSIVIRGLKDSTKIFGSLVDEKGKFEITQIPLGSYKLTISFVGYKDFVIEKILVIPPDKIEQNLGTLKVLQDETLLEEVQVIAEKSVLQLGVDKKVFNVDKSALSSGGSATDVLKQVPTVDVDVDGNISMRGSGNITVFINGKPSGITGANKQAVLDAIPSSTIESVEIINNPGAKYDAQGEGGIINLVLKKNIKKGFNGNISLGYGTFYKNNAGVSINYKKNKINLSTNYGFRFNENTSWNDNNRKNFTDSTLFYLRTHEDSRRNNISNTLSENLDININDKNTLSLNSLVGYNYNIIDETNYFDFTDSLDILYNASKRKNEEIRKNLNADAGIVYRTIFKSNTNDLNLSANYSYLNSNSTPKYKEQQLSIIDRSDLSVAPALSTNNSTTINHLATFQADYVQPFEKIKGKLEVGGKISYRYLSNDFYADSTNRSNGDVILNTALINTFIYNEEVNAVYSIYGGSFKKFSYKGGIRMEQSNIKGIQEVGNQTNSQHYIDFFPSVFLSQKLPKNHELQLAYRRSINRPDNQQLNPFGDYSNPYNIRRGNPALKPAYTDAVELTYLKSFEKGYFISATGYFRYTSNFFTRFVNVDSNGFATVTFGNLANAQNIGVELITRASFTKWWNVLLNVNLFNNRVMGSIPNGEIDANSNSFQWNLRFTSNMSVWKTASIQFSLNYRSKINYLQGYIKPNLVASIGFKKDFLKNNRASIAINIQDLFHTQRFEIESSGQNFKTSVSRISQSTVANITFTYKFGRSEEKSTPKKRSNTEDMGGGGMDGGF